MVTESLMIILNAGVICLVLGIICFALVCIALALFKLIFVIADKLFGDDGGAPCLSKKR